MTKGQGKSGTIEVKALLAEDEEFLRALVRTALQEVLEAEMTEALGAEKGERAAGRQGYRSAKLTMPRDRPRRLAPGVRRPYGHGRRRATGPVSWRPSQRPDVAPSRSFSITKQACFVADSITIRM